MELLMPCLNTLTEYWGRKNPPSREYKNLAPIAVLVGLGVWIKPLGNERSKDEVAGAIPLAPSLHL